MSRALPRFSKPTRGNRNGHPTFSAHFRNVGVDGIPVIAQPSIVITVGVDVPYVTVTFTTNVVGGTGLEEGPTIAYGTAVVNPPESVTSHSITMNIFDGLQVETDLHGRVASNNAAGIGYSADFTFSTKSAQYMIPGYGLYTTQGHSFVVGQTYAWMIPGYGLMIEAH